MLDSRRDCRYRRGAHRSIGIGLGKVTFHNMLGTSSGVPGFPLTLIHPSAWKVNSANFRLKLSEKSWRCPNQGLTRVADGHFSAPNGGQTPARGPTQTPFQTVSGRSSQNSTSTHSGE